MNDEFHPFKYLSVATSTVFVVTILFVEWVSWNALIHTLFMMVMEYIVVIGTVVGAACYSSFKLWAMYKGDVSGTWIPTAKKPLTPAQLRAMKEQKSSTQE